MASRTLGFLPTLALLKASLTVAFMLAVPSSAWAAARACSSMSTRCFAMRPVYICTGLYIRSSSLAASPGENGRISRPLVTSTEFRVELGAKTRNRLDPWTERFVASIL